MAACAPSDKFLYMGGMLGMGLGVVVVSSIGKQRIPPPFQIIIGYSI